MEKEIKIVLKDANDLEWQKHPFDVFVDGEIIPRIKRFALDFKYFEPNQTEFDAECFTYTLEQFLDICEQHQLNKCDIQKLKNYGDAWQSVSENNNEDMKASKKCLSDALERRTYTTKDFLGEVSRILHDENISDGFKDFLAKAIAGERNKSSLKSLNKSNTQSLWEYIHNAPNLVKRMLNAETEAEASDIFNDAIKTGEAKLVKEYTVMPPYLPTAIRYNISSLKDLGFDITYDSDANKLTVKNMEHLAELNGDSIEETKKIRKEAEYLISDTTDMVKALDDINNKNI